MKVIVKCVSPLLQRTLEIYLKAYLYDIELAEVLITDTEALSEKVVFRIGDMPDAQLSVPFTREELMNALEKFYETNPRLVHLQHTKETLESMIEKLNRRHQEKIAKLIRRYHEKA